MNRKRISIIIHRSFNHDSNKEIKNVRDYYYVFLPRFSI